QKLSLQFAAIEHSRFRGTSRVANDDVFYLATAELADRIEVGHHVQVIEREHDHGDANTLGTGDFEEVSRVERLRQLAVQMRTGVHQSYWHGRDLPQNRDELVEIVSLAAQRDKL